MSGHLDSGKRTSDTAIRRLRLPKEQAYDSRIVNFAASSLTTQAIPK